MKKKQLGCIKDLNVLNYKIIKQQVRSDGQSVCMCSMENDSAVLIAHVGGDGHIINSQVYVLTPDNKKKITKAALSTYRKWSNLLMILQLGDNI